MKLNSKNIFKILIVLILLLLLAIFYNVRELNLYNKLVSLDKKQVFQVEKTYCKTRGGSKIKLRGAVNKTIEVPENLCNDVSEGEDLELYYDEATGSIYYPGADRGINRLIGFFLILLALSVFISIYRIYKLLFY